MLILGLVAILAGAGYIGYLDWVVRAKFAGKRWELPARVYARPLELYAGAALAPRELQAELKGLGYRPVRTVARPGTFGRTGSTFEVYARPFTFWDGKAPARRIRVRFSGERVADVSDGAGHQLGIARLDPPVIGAIYPARQEDRVLVRLSEVPPQLVRALIATEDRNFYQHHGIDPRAIARALWADLRAGALVQGGSTLTQQLVKNFYLSRERSLVRKVNEALMALLLELHYDKDAILEAYLNEVYLGQDGARAIHGFGLAAHFYYGRPLRELNLAQLTQLVALVKGPSYYDPRRHPQRARERRNLVLELMASQGAITPVQARHAEATPSGVVTEPPSGSTPYPAFIDLVRRQLRRDYDEADLTTEGLRIFTTFDPRVQKAAEASVVRELPRLEARTGTPSGKLEAAVLVTDPRNGEIQAVVGGRRPRYAGFDRALDAVRQVGSLMKPVVYMSALEQRERYTLATPLDDKPLGVKGPDGKVWVPNNYDRRSHGTIPLYEALAHSYNVATVRLGMQVGLSSVEAMLHRLGVERQVSPYPAMLLGATALSPLEVTQIYQTIAAGGFHTPLRAIREVTTAAGAPLTRYDLAVEKAVDPGIDYLVTYALQKVVEEGTARGLSRELADALHPAGKTGTTDDLRDSWFAGFTGDRLAVVWVGRDDNAPTGLTGASGALRVWQGLFQRTGALPLKPSLPSDVQMARVAITQGQDDVCDTVEKLPFIEGTAPASGSVCSESGTVAGGGLKSWLRGLGL
jgi:penicillin-binding protein 1B